MVLGLVEQDPVVNVDSDQTAVPLQRGYLLCGGVIMVEEKPGNSVLDSTLMKIVKCSGENLDRYFNQSFYDG